ncbi:MFS domain-containing protein [Fusarium keratoplasticum]|nr:MFS domain-containing protein [Fusarium keratoplasticum]
MTFGILKIAADQPSPPSTSLLKNLSANTQDAEVFLVPQPSASPADPLNMSRIRKELYFAALIYGACVTGVVGPVLVPGFSIVAAAFQINLTQVTLLNGSLVMGLGASSAKSYNSLLGARIFQELGMGTFFSVAGTASINDVFFIHQRGSRAGFWNFAVIVSWSFRLLAISFALAFVFSFFLMPETLFDRDSVVAGVEPSISVSDHLEAKSSASPALGAPDSVNDASSVGPPDKPALWKQTLGLKNVQMQPITQLIPILLRPPGLPRHPAIIWACAMWSVTYSWVIIQGAVADQIFRAPPYNLSPTSVGLLIGIAPLVGSAIGTILGGWMCDWMAQLMVKQNGGVYEPGFRLVVAADAFGVTMLVKSAFAFGLTSHEVH